MILLLVLLVQMAAPPDGDLPGFDDPPTEMIDFLGRRMLCAQGAEETARRRLRCRALDGEERAFRQRFAGDAQAVRWLDQPPLQFHLRRRFVSVFDGPTPVQPRRMEQTGVDSNGRGYRIVIDAEADRGSSTRISASYDGWPERSFPLSNRLFPDVDIQSVTVSTYDPPPRRAILIEFSYGEDRSYCGTQGDNRPDVTVLFERGRVRAQGHPRTNCSHETVSIDENAR